jgi:PAS domain S-box-containing protein
MRVIKSRIQFLNFKIKRNLLYAAFIGCVLWVYIVVLLSLLDTLKRFPDLFFFVIAFGVIFAALGFGPLELMIRSFTNSIFYKKRAGYHTIITEMLKTMSANSELGNLTELIVSTIYNEMKIESIAFYLKSADQTHYEIINQHNWESLQGISMGDELVACIRQEKRILSKDHLMHFLMRSKQRLKQKQLFYKLNSYHAEVAVPFFENDDLLGFLLLGKKASGDPYYEEELHLLELIGNQSVLGLKGSRLFEISQNRVKEFAALFEVGRLMSSTLDITEIFTTIIKAVIQVVNIDRGILFLYDDKKEELYSVTGYGAKEKDVLGITLKVGDSVLGRIFKAGVPVLVPHTTRQTEYVKRLGVQSYIVVPMKAKNRIIGLLTLDNAPSGRTLENINMDLLMTLAGQMGIAIENAKLYDEAQEKVKQLSALNENISNLKSYNEDILETMPSGVISFDTDGRIVTFNAMAELITGWSATEAIHGGKEKIWSQFPELLHAVSTECTNVEVPYTDRSGKKKPLNITTKQLRDRDEHSIGMLSVLTDISELKLLEQQIRRSDRVSALGTMVAGVAHEIKNPLTSMKMFVQLMEEHKADKNFWEEYGSIIATEVERLETIVEDFLGFARTPDVHFKEICLKDITTKVYQLVKTQSRKENVEIIIDIDDSIKIKVDIQRIMQVFLNLVLNAIQAMPQKRPEKSWVKFSAVKDVPNKIVSIVVADNGIGISKENLEKLFTPFFTTKIKGTGLGLSIAHKIIEEHGGNIDVKSELGVGTTFSITLPLVVAECA